MGGAEPQAARLAITWLSVVRLDWQRSKLQGTKKVFHSDTQFSQVTCRTQFFGWKQIVLLGFFASMVLIPSTAKSQNPSVLLYCYNNGPMSETYYLPSEITNPESVCLGRLMCIIDGTSPRIYLLDLSRKGTSWGRFADNYPPSPDETAPCVARLKH
jgi:hypothetical protein